MNDVYRIKSMDWIYTSQDDYGSEDEPYEKWEASSPLFFYRIEHDVRDDTWTGWFCFDEYYDDGPFDAGSSLEEAKENAFAHWKERLSTVLLKIDSKS